MHNHALVMVRGSRFALVTCEAGEAALARVLYLGIGRILYFIDYTLTVLVHVQNEMCTCELCGDVWGVYVHYAVMLARCVSALKRTSLDLEHLINTLPIILSRHMTRAD